MPWPKRVLPKYPLAHGTDWRCPISRSRASAISLDSVDWVRGVTLGHRMLSAQVTLSVCLMSATGTKMVVWVWSNQVHSCRPKALNSSSP